MEEKLRIIVTTEHRDQFKTLFLHTDASYNVWAPVATQFPTEDVMDGTDSKTDEPLAFLSGAFTGAQEHFTTYEKEAYMIMQPFKKHSHLFACDSATIVFTDHRHVRFTFHPTALDRLIGRDEILKVTVGRSFCLR